jgi:hypothetical protein
MKLAKLIRHQFPDRYGCVTAEWLRQCLGSSLPRHFPGTSVNWPTLRWRSIEKLAGQNNVDTLAPAVDAVRDFIKHCIELIQAIRRRAPLRFRQRTSLQG